MHKNSSENLTETVKVSMQETGVKISYMTCSSLCPQASMRWLIPWWRHQMETFSVLLALCAGNSPVTGEFPAQRPVTRSFDISFDLRPNKRLSKQPWSWWFETPSWSLWRQCNAYRVKRSHIRSRTASSYHYHFDGLLQNCAIYIADAMEIPQSCPNPMTLFVMRK